VSEPHLALGPGSEFERIRAVLAALGPMGQGIGGDCALIPGSSGTLALSIDSSVEGVHFRRDWLSPEEIGWRATAGALSDLAAAGAAPVGVLAAVTLPSSTAGEELVAVMRGVGTAAALVGGSVLGGDLSRGPSWSITITVLGRAVRPVTRAAARPGDRLWVTGALGGARAALTYLEQAAPVPEDARRAFARPEPRIRAGLKLAELGAHAMIDLSDGLGGDARHLAAASEVALAIDLERVPVSPGARIVAAQSGTPAERFAAEGGEDYELLAALPPSFGERDAVELSHACGVPLTLIGKVREGSGVRFSLGRKDLPLHGWDHFANGR
jgi:thiamine-monophosphate kinase